MATELSSFAELKKVAPTSGGPGTQILARHKSSDGYFWQVGVTVRRAPGQPRGVDTPSPFDIRLLQNVEG